MILHLSCQNSCSFLFSPFKNSPWFRTCSKLMLCDVSYIVGKEHTWSWWVMLSWYASKPTLKVMHAKCAINPRNTAFVSVFWCEWAVPLSKHHLQKSRLELSHGAELDMQTNSLWCLRFNHTLEMSTTLVNPRESKAVCSDIPTPQTSAAWGTCLTPHDIHISPMFHAQELWAPWGMNSRLNHSQKSMGREGRRLYLKQER